MQLYYNGSPQIVGGNPPSSGSGGPSVWPILRVGTTNIGNTYTPWTSATTSGSQIGNVYTALTRLTYQDAATTLTYTLDINWSYTAPNQYLTWSYNLTVPT